MRAIEISSLNWLVTPAPIKVKKMGKLVSYRGKERF